MKKWITARLNVCRWVGLAVLITQVRHTECALSTFADVPAGTPSCADRWGAVTGLSPLKRCLGVLFLLLLLAYLISAIHCSDLASQTVQRLATRNCSRWSAMWGGDPDTFAQGAFAATAIIVRKLMVHCTLPIYYHNFSVLGVLTAHAGMSPYQIL